MPTITKRDLVVRISNETGMTQQQVFDVLQHFIDDATACLAQGDEVVLRNFGTFQVKRTEPKIGRNPNKPAQVVTIPERKVVKFKPGKIMKQLITDRPMDGGSVSESDDAPEATSSPGF